MRFLPLVLVTKSIPPLSPNAISADWVHQRRCCVRWFEMPSPNNKLISLEWTVAMVTRCSTKKELHPGPHLTHQVRCVHVLVSFCVTTFPDENHLNYDKKL